LFRRTKFVLKIRLIIRFCLPLLFAFTNIASGESCEDKSGFDFLEACWYSAKTNGTSCGDVCGDLDMQFDSERAVHNGPAYIAKHFFPYATEASSPKHPFECGQSDSIGQIMTIFGANNEPAEESWKQESCIIICPCIDNRQNIGRYNLSREQRNLVFYILCTAFGAGWIFIGMSCPTKRENRTVTRYGMRGYHKALLSNDAEQIKEILGHMGSKPMNGVELSIDHTDSHLNLEGTFSKLQTHTMGSTVNPSITPTHRLSHSRVSLTQSSLFDSEMTGFPAMLGPTNTPYTAITV